MLSVYDQLREMGAQDLPDAENWPQGPADKALSHIYWQANYYETNGGRLTVEEAVAEGVDVGNHYGRIQDFEAAKHAADRETAFREAVQEHADNQTIMGYPVPPLKLGRLVTQWLDSTVSDAVKSYYYLNDRWHPLWPDRELLILDAMTRRTQEVKAEKIKLFDHLAYLDRLYGRTRQS